MSAAHPRLLGILLVLLSAAGFAIGPTAAKLAFDDGSNPLTVLACRSAIGTVLTAALMLGGGVAFRIPRRAWPACLLAGAASAVASYGFIASVAYIPVSLAVAIFFAHPVFVAAIWHWRGGERLTPRKLALALAALLGVALALGGTWEGLDLTGVMLAALAAVTIALMIHASARAQRDAASTQVNLVLNATTAVFFAVLTTAAGAWAMPGGAVGWTGLLLAGVGITVGLLALLAAFRYIGPVRATMLSNVEPLIAILFAMALLGERLGALQWAGVAIVVAALTLFEWPGRRKPTG